MENINPDLSMSVEFSDSPNNNIVDSMARYIVTLIAYDRQVSDSDCQNCIIRDFTLYLLEVNDKYSEWVPDPKYIISEYIAYEQKLTAVK